METTNADVEIGEGRGEEKYSVLARSSDKQ